MKLKKDLTRISPANLVLLMEFLAICGIVGCISVVGGLLTALLSTLAQRRMTLRQNIQQATFKHMVQWLAVTCVLDLFFLLGSLAVTFTMIQPKMLNTVEANIALFRVSVILLSGIEIVRLAAFSIARAVEGLKRRRNRNGSLHT